MPDLYLSIPLLTPCIGGRWVCVYGRCTLWVSTYNDNVHIIVPSTATALHNHRTQFVHTFISYAHTLPLSSPLPHSPGDLPYRDIPLPSLLAQVISGYRLPKPEHASEEVWVHISLFVTIEVFFIMHRTQNTNWYIFLIDIGAKCCSCLSYN